MRATSIRGGSLCFFLILCTPLALGQATLGRRTSLDLNAVPPQDVFGSLARTLDCGVEIDPAVTSAVTIRLQNITIRTALNVICESIGCSWRMTGHTLHVDRVAAREPGHVAQESIRKVFDRQTPADFRFQNAPLKDVLEALGKVGGMQITADEPDARRPVTLDLSNRSILSALQEIGRTNELKSAVMIAASRESGRELKIRFARKTGVEGSGRPPGGTKDK